MESWIEEHPYKMALIVGIIVMIGGWFIISVQNSSLNIPFDWEGYLLYSPLFFLATFSLAGLSKLSERHRRN